MKLIFVEDVAKLKVLFSVDTKHITTVVLLKDSKEEDLPSKEGITLTTWDVAMEHKSKSKLEICSPRGGDLGPREWNSFEKSKIFIFLSFSWILS